MDKTKFIEEFNRLKEKNFWKNNVFKGKYVDKKFIKDFINLAKLPLKIKVNGENSLYKYSPADNYSIENLKNSNLFFKFAKNFSDESDSLFEADNLSSQSLKNKLDVELNKVVQRDCLVTCFTETNLDNKMWNTYADKNRGFCQEYSLEELQKRFIEDIINKDSYIENICPVIYAEKVYKATEYFPAEYTEDISKVENFKIIIVPVLFFSTLTKLFDFSFENEWRWFRLFTSDLPNSSKFGEVEKGLGMLRKIIPPKAIYLGTDMEEGKKKEIIKICKFMNISVYQMKLEKNVLSPIPIMVYQKNSLV